jgi:hypothetical protein
MARDDGAALPRRLHDGACIFGEEQDAAADEEDGPPGRAFPQACGDVDECALHHQEPAFREEDEDQLVP